MAGALGRNHHDVNVCGRNDGLEMNAEAVRETEDLAFGEAWLNCGFVEVGLSFVRGKNLDPVSFPGRFRRREHAEAIRHRLFGAAAGRVESDDDVVAAVAQVLRLGVSLAAVAEDCDSLAFEGGRISVVLVEDGGQGKLL